MSASGTEQARRRTDGASVSLHLSRFTLGSCGGPVDPTDAEAVPGSGAAYGRAGHRGAGVGHRGPTAPDPGTGPVRGQDLPGDQPYQGAIRPDGGDWLGRAAAPGA